MFWGVFYGAVVLVTAALAAFSGGRREVGCAVMLVFGWAISNIVIAGYEGPPSLWPYALIDFVGGSVGFLLFLSRPCWWCGLLASAFFAQSGLHIAFGANLLDARLYFPAINILFSIQCLAVATASTSEIMHQIRRRERRAQRVRDGLRGAKSALMDFPKW